MSKRVNEILGRRAVLISRAAIQREEIARKTAWFEPQLRIVDSVMRAGKQVKRHPAVISSVAAFLAVTQWRRLAKLPKRLYQGYMLFNVFRNLRLPFRSA